MSVNVVKNWEAADFQKILFTKKFSLNLVVLVVGEINNNPQLSCVCGFDATNETIKILSQLLSVNISQINTNICQEIIFIVTSSVMWG